MQEPNLEDQNIEYDEPNEILFPKLGVKATKRLEMSNKLLDLIYMKDSNGNLLKIGN